MTVERPNPYQTETIFCVVRKGWHRKRHIWQTVEMDQKDQWRLDLGAQLIDPETTRFRVWAPYARTVDVKIIDPTLKTVRLTTGNDGYHEAVVSGVGRGALYRYVLDGEKERPDPASRFQPQGVHGPSCIVDPGLFRWSDQAWSGLDLSRLIVYELHIGTFTAEGTFDAAIARLPYLKDGVGVTAIEVMPIAQFPGSRNWGYDGVYPFAPQSTYGGPDGFKRLVNACHEHGLAVVLDVVYNHLGPEGNYLNDYGPYFTDRYRTPWGLAINYDGADSDEVRRYIISNALYWIGEYHVDGLRLDAIHGIYDFSARHILSELSDAVHAEGRRLGRSTLVIAESDLNDARIIAPHSAGGYGLDAQWSDDFHHALHTVLTGEQAGYYEDFGRLDQLATAFKEGFIFSGQHSKHRRRRHGNSARDCAPSQLVICAQNHDQTGNRAFGDRLSALVSPEALKVACAAVLLAPQTPLLFMGEEYGETAPFQYFIDHGDPALIEAVRQGRRKEFAAFGWKDVPDPYDVATFERSRLRLNAQPDARQQDLLRWYAALIRLRKTVPALGSAQLGTHGLDVRSYSEHHVLVLHRWQRAGTEALVVLSFNKAGVQLPFKPPQGRWTLRLSSISEDRRTSGETPVPTALDGSSGGIILPVPPYGVLVYLKE